VADVAVSYRVAGGLNLTLGANNVLDSYPDTVITPNQTRGIYPFSGQSPAGFNGRYVYTRAAIDFTTLAVPFRRSASTSIPSDEPSKRNQRASQERVQGVRPDVAGRRLPPERNPSLGEARQDR
jgi:hypothetical protein